MSGFARPFVRRCTVGPALACRRSWSSFSAQEASHRSNRVQIYVSRSGDPYLNLSVEHRLLQVTPPDSTVLILYTNAPSIIFGRNQNPWLEVNLPLLARIAQDRESAGWTDERIHLVRRRSGGGTVFHDSGNVNFSVICPPEAFDRDKHAEMVVRALASLGRANTRVNERHDIVMDVSSENDMKTFKISGSAYKLTRLRSLHHGTCLLRSPNLKKISGLLRSPAEGFIQARGVESVRSPVRNVDLGNEDFQAAVMNEFRKMYGDASLNVEFGTETLESEKIAQGYDELVSRNWIYAQTPRFTFSTHPTEDDPRPRPELPFTSNIHLVSRHGVIEEMMVNGENVIEASDHHPLAICNVENWTELLQGVGLKQEEASNAGSWMNQVLGTEFTKV